MPLYALPIYRPSLYSTQDPHLRQDQHHQPASSSSKKRKRNEHSPSTSPSPPSSSENEDADGDEDEDDADTRSLYAASTNPLSLTPDEIMQYRLAGLELDEVLPSQRVKGFPHRGLPGHIDGEDENEDIDVIKQGEDEFDDDEEGDGSISVKQRKRRQDRGPRLRRHHLVVLTTLLHRCLAEGDLERAGRAWALLLRAELGGLPIDIRNTGFWGIGAELLIRGQKKRGEHASTGHNDIEDSHPDEDGEVVRERKRDTSSQDSAPKRWGTPEGLEKAKEYYERLILQYPYMRQFSNAVSALDFWPAMLGCEIYGIQFTQKGALWKISKEEERDKNDDNEDEDTYSGEDVANEEDHGADYQDDDYDDGFSFQERRQARRRAKRAHRRWEQREGVRKTALEAAETLANRIDELMTTLPYSDSHVLLRLRGMLALYVGDLSIPELPPDEIDDDHEQQSQNSRLDSSQNDAERRIARRQRETERQRGVQKQEEEKEHARRLFQKILDEGGSIGGSIQDIISQGGGDDPSEEIYDADYEG
ncbi:hypothetical protein F5884DRAFT_679840 [Xylogone sp. PMI_703]|nr:hypothetical protein F5884DRAFT_679840 [Xylogone sp. PMI_703]